MKGINKEFAHEKCTAPETTVQKKISNRATDHKQQELIPAQQIN
jgi:hypothetical protein